MPFQQMLRKLPLTALEAVLCTEFRTPKANSPVHTKIRGHVAMSRLLSRQSRLPPGSDISQPHSHFLKLWLSPCDVDVVLLSHSAESYALKSNVAHVFSFQGGPPRASQTHGRQDDSRPATSTSSDVAFARIAMETHPAHRLGTKLSS